ncbi:hypothetical protein BKA82DRAFT_29946 [Pisolithus tinctorius]|uniref:Uncharacterized protein n=1 Tax=Pisolithus tinctorius Marx 270 TaxID=870435 RepID=A0A0C3ISM9_PISTI|nr:hypothetical protein BKA82DRAFT_29946 [Pisolithus tinctorius]KIN99892.1 hypothetical protein M404DRAFT_29946 [Pisolithus tinctorius Marx 270]
MIPTEPIIVLAPITTCKLCKGDYCELYFFTNKGLKDVELTPQSTDDDAMALLQLGDGLHSFVPIAATHAKGNITRDKDLSWEEFTKAAHCLVSAMKDNDWPKGQTHSHVRFWLALENHPWRHGSCNISKKALLEYQASIHCRWHNTLSTPQSFNIALINNMLLTQIQDKLVHSAWVVELNSFRQVSFSLQASLNENKLTNKYPLTPWYVS